MGQTIACSVILALFISFFISFLMTRVRRNPDGFLFWSSCPREKRLFYVVSSNLGSFMSLFVFICGQMLVAFCHGALAAIVMLLMVMGSYFGVAYLLQRALRRKESPWHALLENCSSSGETTPERLSCSVIELLGKCFGRGSASLCAFIVISFIVLALASELVMFQGLLLSAMPRAASVSFPPQVIMVTVLIFCTVYVVRGGFESVFKTDVFQLGLIVVVLGVCCYLFAGSDLVPDGASALRVFTHPTNAVGLTWPGWVAIPIYLFVTISYVLAGIDQWNRSLVFLRDPKKTVRAFRWSGAGAGVLAGAATYLGLCLRLWPPTAEKFLVDRGGVLTLRSFCDVTLLPFSEEALGIFKCMPNWAVALIWAALASMALTTIDSLLITVPQVVRQVGALWRVIPDEAGESRAAVRERCGGRERGLLYAVLRVVAVGSSSPRLILAGAAGVVGVLASLLSRGPYAGPGLWGWSAQGLVGVMILYTLVAANTRRIRWRRGIFRCVLAMMTVWYVGFILNLVGLSRQGSSAALLPICTVLFSIALYGLLLWCGRGAPDENRKGVGDG